MSHSIRRTLPEAADLLTDLALRSKAYWGYSREFLEACRGDLTITPAYIAENDVFVLEEAAGILGFYALRAGRDEAELTFLFVEPSVISRGLGRALWDHATQTARQRGYRAIVIESDPNAESFYRAMGAQREGERVSPVDPTRKLPLLRFPLEPMTSTAGSSSEGDPLGASAHVR